MDIRLLNALPRRLLLPVIGPEPLIPVRDMPLKVELARPSEARHQLWWAQGKLIATVDLPEVVDLSVQPHNLLHLLRLGLLPEHVHYDGLGHDEHPGLDFVDVTMPQLALLGIKALIQRGRDHVFDADDARAGVRAVVEYALTHVVVEVPTVMVRLDMAGRI